MKQERQVRDVMIVLGGGIDADGNLMKPSMCRVKFAAKLFHEGAAKYIIVSSKWSFQLEFTPKRTIADAMKAELMNLGVPEGNIILEDQSYDTIGNIYFSKLILKKHHWQNILVITSEFQEKRASYLCKKILGPDYHIKFSITDNGLTQEELKQQRKVEKQLLSKIQIFVKLFRFKEGDDDTIKKLLLKKHPAYNSALEKKSNEWRADVKSPFHENNSE